MKTHFHSYLRQIGLNLVIPGGTKIIDASGKFVMPGLHLFLFEIQYYINLFQCFFYILKYTKFQSGGIDTDTQLECSVMGTRSIDDFFTGTRAAVAGGTTTIRTYLARKSIDQTLTELTVVNSPSSNEGFS